MKGMKCILLGNKTSMKVTNEMGSINNHVKSWIASLGTANNECTSVDQYWWSASIDRCCSGNWFLCAHNAPNQLGPNRIGRTHVDAEIMMTYYAEQTFPWGKRNPPHPPPEPQSVKRDPEGNSSGSHLVAMVTNDRWPPSLGKWSHWGRRRMTAFHLRRGNIHRNEDWNQTKRDSQIVFMQMHCWLVIRNRSKGWLISLFMKARL